ncbi:RidA family protein [Chloroflexota bacterium]
MSSAKGLTYVTPRGFPKPRVASTYGIKTKQNASLIFTGGVAPLDDEGKNLVGIDIYAQTCRVMDKIKELLDAAEATLDDVVSLRIFVADINNWERCCEAYSKYFKQLPTVALDLVSNLTYRPGQLVEIEATAAV